MLQGQSLGLILCELHTMCWATLTKYSFLPCFSPLTTVNLMQPWVLLIFSFLSFALQYKIVFLSGSCVILILQVFFHLNTPNIELNSNSASVF